MSERRPDRSFLDGESGRISLSARGFLISIALAGAITAWEVTGRPNPIEDSVSGFHERVSRILDICTSPCGEPVEGAERKLYFTVPHGEYSEIPVRSSPTANTRDENLIAWTTPGFIVDGLAHNGLAYAGDANYAKFTDEDGNLLGEWIKVNQVPAFEKGTDGELVPIMENGRQKTLDGVFIATNFALALTEGDYLERFRMSKEDVLASLE